MANVLAEAQREREEARRAAGPTEAVTKSPCTQATAAGPRFTPSQGLGADARHILILQPEGSTPQQLRRVAEANFGRCLFVQGTTFMPMLMAS